MSNGKSKTIIGRPFVKGQVANPKGRPRGIPDRRTKYRELIEPHLPALVDKCVTMALGGDVQALRLCLERVFPAMKPGDEHVELAPEGSSYPSEQARVVVDALLSGRITPASASALMMVIVGQVRVIEVDELMRRIDALERVSSERSVRQVGSAR
jgi:hypothetical protein